MPKRKRKLVYVTEPPPGLFYIPGFLDEAQQRELLKQIVGQPFKQYDYHGYLAKREIVLFGQYEHYSKDNELTGPIPRWLKPLRSQCANLVGLSEDELEMALVAHYPVGAGIGWHRDAPQFGPTVIGISLGSNTQMRFRRFIAEEEHLFKITLERGSVYVMSGPARSVWQHGMLPVTELRYSITFRTVKKSSVVRSDERHAPDAIAQRLSMLGFTDAGSCIAGTKTKQLNLLDLIAT